MGEHPIKKPVRKKMGRPSKYETIDLIQVEKLAGLGLIDVEIADVLDISTVTLNKYKKRKDFINSLKKGKILADSKVVESLYKRALGFEYDEVTYEVTKAALGIGIKKSEAEGKEAKLEVQNIKAVPMNKVKVVVKQVVPDPVACIFWLKNRRSDQWRDKIIAIDNSKHEKYITIYLPNKSGRENVMEAISQTRDIPGE